MNAPATLTVLSDMVGVNLQDQLDWATRWALKTLDLKTVFGKNVADLSDDQADELANLPESITRRWSSRSSDG